MHPQIQMPEPGLCPICGMSLIQLVDEGGPWELTLSEQAVKLAQIRTAEVVRRFVPKEIRMLGKVAYDEKRLGVISAWIPGRIDRLFVDYTGIEVQQGDHMVQLYSPEWVSAQQELLQALKARESGHETAKAAAGKRVAATREKLRLMGLSPAQITAVEKDEGVTEHATIEAPMGGIVIEKHLNEGAYVKMGTPIYTVADLSRVWINLDAYESDLAWLRYGQEVDFEVAAYPGETFRGRIVFIDPTLNPRTRTVTVRLDIPNPAGRLKPDMFVRALAYALISPTGKVMDESLAGKWISPMHPEIVKQGPGNCDVCGMDLVPAEQLGFVTAAAGEPPLVIPASAALVTGERAVVYLAEGSTYHGREIVLGPQVGDYFVVKAGLEEGERVVVNGAFKIDSELQIRARHSMMYHPSPEPAPSKTEASQVEHTPARAAFVTSLKPLLQSFFQVQKALSDDQLPAARRAAESLAKAHADLDDNGLAGADRTAWLKQGSGLEKTLITFSAATSLAEARIAFEPLSDILYQVASHFGLPPGVAAYRFHCPMAFDNRGADWLQDHRETRNPYFGAVMLTCGSQIEVLAVSEEQHRHE